jgi:hypothetical protein
MIAAIELKEDILLYPAQGQVAILINDVLQGPAMRCLDKDVRVNEITRCQPRQNDANGALARPGHPDQNDIGSIFGHDLCSKKRRKPHLP